MLLVGKEYVMDRAYSMHGDMANAYRISVRKRKGTRWLQKPRRRWEDNINMNLIEKEMSVWVGTATVSFISNACFLLAEMIIMYCHQTDGS